MLLRALTPRAAAHTAAAPAAARSQRGRGACEAPSSSTSIQLQRILEMQQLLDGAALAGHSYSTAGDSAASDSSSSSGSSRPGGSKRSGGFGAARKQAKGAVISADAACPCRSGLSYKHCCQPFLEGGKAPRSAPELVRARLTAATTGNVAFLVATTHPDSNLLLGGTRDAASRAKRMCAVFKANQLELVGMAHCAGDLPGSWVVLYVLQATAGNLAGTKAPYMDLLVRRTAAPLADMFSAPGQQQQKQQQGAGGSEQQQPWLFLKRTTQLPDSSDTGALVELLQLHVPEVLQSSDGQQQQQQQRQGFAYRQLCFSWEAPWLPAVGGDGGADGWHLDLLQPAAARMSRAPGSGDGGGPSSGQQQLPPAALLPPGVFCMDEYLLRQHQHSS